MALVVVVDGQADLLQVVDALRAPGGLAGRLHGGQEQADQDGDDGDDDEQFDEREAVRVRGARAAMMERHEILLDGRAPPPRRPMGGPKGRASRRAWVWGRKGSLAGRRSTSRIACRGSSRGRPQTTRGGSAGEQAERPGTGRGAGKSRPRRSRSMARRRRARPARSDTRSGTGRRGSPKGRRGKPSTGAPTDAGEDRCNRPRDATPSSSESSPWSCAPWASTVARAYIRVSPTYLALNSPSAANHKVAVHGLDARRASEFQSWNAHHVRVKQPSSRISRTRDASADDGRSDGVREAESGRMGDGRHETHRSTGLARGFDRSSGRRGRWRLPEGWGWSGPPTARPT